MSGVRMVFASGATVLAEFDAEGVERDTEYSDIERHIKWVDSLGGPPRAVQILSGPAEDVVPFSCTLWTGTANAAILEANMPPYAPGGITYLYHAGLASSAFWPGFGNWNAGTSEWYLQNVTATIESQGKKAVGVDLFGYKLEGSFAACGFGTALNERGNVVPSSTTLPAILAKKFASHKNQEASVSIAPNPVNGAPFPLAVRQGRRWDSNVQLDHIETSDMDAVVNWFRAIRGTPFPIDSSVSQAFGPLVSGTGTQAVARKLNVYRGSGWWWEAKLELSLWTGA